MVLVQRDRAEDMLAALETGADDVLIGQPERRSAVAHLAALLRRRQPRPATLTAHELAVGIQSAQPVSVPAPQDDRLREVLEGLGIHLRSARRLARENAAAEEIAAARATLSDLCRLLGMEIPPTDAEESPAPAPPAPLAPSSADASWTVLLIEDETQVREPLRLALEHCGYSVLEASDGEEGLELMTRRGHDIDLVVVDQRMPRLSGAEVLREIRRRDEHLPVVLMSGQPLSEIEAALGPDAFLRKPFELVDLSRTVHRLVGREDTTTR
jgi:DNA-binding response OmpR family regulator